jgi:hypothetical protein
MINTSEFGLSQKNRDKFSSVKEQAFNFMWDGINWKKGGKYFADKYPIK